MADDQRQKTRVSPSGIRTAIKIARWAFSPGKMVFASVFGIMISTFIFVTVFAATEGGVIAPVDIPPGEEQPPPPPGEEPPPPPPTFRLVYLLKKPITDMTTVQIFKRFMRPIRKHPNQIDTDHFLMAPQQP